MRQSCFPCHSRNGGQTDFESLVTEQDWLNSGLIAVGDAASSRLVIKLKNAGGNMPLNASQISNDDYTAIRGWIDQLSNEDVEWYNFDGAGDPYLEGLSLPDLPASATPLKDEEKVFRRCYAQFLNEPVLETDSRLLSVKYGTVKGVDACMSLFGLAKFSTSNNTEIALGNTVGQKILSSFHKLHSSFIPVSYTHLTLPTKA